LPSRWYPNSFSSFAVNIGLTSFSPFSFLHQMVRPQKFTFALLFPLFVLEWGHLVLFFFLSCLFFLCLSITSLFCPSCPKFRVSFFRCWGPRPFLVPLSAVSWPPRTVFHAFSKPPIDCACPLPFRDVVVSPRERGSPSIYRSVC